MEWNFNGEVIEWRGPAEYPSDWPAICLVAEKLGIGSAETLRK